MQICPGCGKSPGGSGIAKVFKVTLASAIVAVCALLFDWLATLVFGLYKGSIPLQGAAMATLLVLSLLSFVLLLISLATLKQITQKTRSMFAYLGFVLAAFVSIVLIMLRLGENTEALFILSPLLIPPLVALIAAAIAMKYITLSAAQKEQRFYKIASIAMMVMIAAVFAFLPKVFELGHTVIFISTIMMYMVLSISWAIFSGPSGYISLASAAFFGAGLYTTAFLYQYLPLPLLMLTGGLVSFIIALIVGAITLRLRGVYFTIFSFALVKLLEALILYFEIHINKRRGIQILTDLTMNRPLLNNTVYYCLVGMVVLVIIVAYIIKRSKLGKALTAIGESEDAAAHVGVNTPVVKVSAYAISAFFVGAVGALWALKVGYVDPSIAFNPLKSFEPILMAIFGGMNALPGPVVGASVFSYITEKLSTSWPTIAMFGTGAVMVIAILFLPSGIVGLLQKIVTGSKRKSQKGVRAALISGAAYLLGGITSLFANKIMQISKTKNSANEKGAGSDDSQS